MRNRLLFVLVFSLLSIGGVGCSFERMQAFHQVVALRLDEKANLSRSRQETRQSLAEERADLIELEAERRRSTMEFDAKRQKLEQDFCQANREAMQEQIERQIRESVKSKVSLDVQQELEIGELQVDEAALKKLLRDRETQRQLAPSPPLPSQQAVQKECDCTDAACVCGGAPTEYHCHHCRSNRCVQKPEPDCGGPAALAQLGRQPVQQPLRPAEIPLMLPIKLRFGVDNLGVEETRVRRLPVSGGEPPRDFVREPAVQKNDVPLPPPDYDSPVQR